MIRPLFDGSRFKPGPVIALAVLLFLGYSGQDRPNHLGKVQQRGELTMLTRNGASTYYLGPDGPTGLEVELVRGFAEFLGVELNILPAQSFRELPELLEAGAGDLIAANLSRTPEREERFNFGPDYQQSSILVLYRRGQKRPRRFEDLVGLNLMVIADSSYEETLELAKKEDKLLLISIGYAACHWCHVMERESFEDSAVAAVMNENFINVNGDREERPDVDQIYMNAVQLLTGRGGWPLNCVALPDGRPLWGGTYFPRENWMNALNQLSDLYANDREKALDYAEKLTQGVQQSGLIALNEKPADFSIDELEKSIDNWKSNMDVKNGGRPGAPKFPMPVNIEFLLRYGSQRQDQEILDYVNTTLTQMAFGGIFDQVGGGFARYSVDDHWHIPHFEKMLYDNAQLVTL